MTDGNNARRPGPRVLRRVPRPESGTSRPTSTEPDDADTGSSPTPPPASPTGPVWRGPGGAVPFAPTPPPSPSVGAAAPSAEPVWKAPGTVVPLGPTTPTGARTPGRAAVTPPAGSGRATTPGGSPRTGPPAGSAQVAPVEPPQPDPPRPTLASRLAEPPRALPPAGPLTPRSAPASEPPRRTPGGGSPLFTPANGAAATRRPPAGPPPALPAAPVEPSRSEAPDWFSSNALARPGRPTAGPGQSARPAADPSAAEPPGWFDRDPLGLDSRADGTPPPPTRPTGPERGRSAPPAGVDRSGRAAAGGPLAAGRDPLGLGSPAPPRSPSRPGGDPRGAHPRANGDPRWADPRVNGAPRGGDPRVNGAPRGGDPRAGGDPRVNGGPRGGDPRLGGDPRANGGARGADPRGGGDPRRAVPTAFAPGPRPNGPGPNGAESLQRRGGPRRTPPGEIPYQASTFDKTGRRIPAEGPDGVPPDFTRLGPPADPALRRPPAPAKAAVALDKEPAGPRTTAAAATRQRPAEEPADRVPGDHHSGGAERRRPVEPASRRARWRAATGPVAFLLRSVSFVGILVLALVVGIGGAYGWQKVHGKHPSNGGAAVAPVPTLSTVPTGQQPRTGTATKPVVPPGWRAVAVPQVAARFAVPAGWRLRGDSLASYFVEPAGVGYGIREVGVGHYPAARTPDQGLAIARKNLGTLPGFAVARVVPVAGPGGTQAREMQASYLRQGERAEFAIRAFTTRTGTYLLVSRAAATDHGRAAALVRYLAGSFVAS